jgi:hypothetical protein
VGQRGLLARHDGGGAGGRRGTRRHRLPEAAGADADRGADRLRVPRRELWALSKGATIPVSLGVLPADGRLVRAQAQDHRPDTQLLISLEPKGGSPSGLPTGPVVYGGKLDPWR